MLIYPDTAGLLDARAGGQVRRLRVAVGQEVRKGQVLMELYLPVLDRQLQQQRGNLAQLERDNRDLDRRDALRLSSERLSVDTALAKLAQDRRRYQELAATYAEKVRNLRWLSKREVVAPLASEVVAAEQGLTSTSVSLDAVRIQEKDLLTRYEQVRLDIQTQALRRRYQIDDMRRQIRVTEARLAFDGQVLADRDGTVLDLQVIQGQTVATGQRLGTLGRAGGGAAGGRGCRPWPTLPRPMPADCRPACRWRWCRSGTSGAGSAASSARWSRCWPCRPRRRTSPPPSATPSWPGTCSSTDR